MKAIVLIFTILLILIFIFVYEYSFVGEFYESLSSNAQRMMSSVESGELNNADAVGILEMWECGKEKLYFFENHEYFKTIEENVNNLQFYVDKGEKRNILFALEKLVLLSEEAKYDFSLSIGNVF